MKRFKSVFLPALTAVVTMVSAGTVSAQNVTKDLQSVLALQGKDCGQVVAAVKQGADHYIAECSNGKRYRVQADANGRVVVTAL